MPRQGRTGGRAAHFTLIVNTAPTIDDPLFERANGKVEIKLFPGATRTSTRTCLAGARRHWRRRGGRRGRLGAHVKALGILGTPYVAKDFEELHKLVTSQLIF